MEEGGLAEFQLGGIGEHPASQVLPAHQGWNSPAETRNRSVDAHLSRDGKRSRSVLTEGNAITCGIDSIHYGATSGTNKLSRTISPRNSIPTKQCSRTRSRAPESIQARRYAPLDSKWKGWSKSRKTFATFASASRLRHSSQNCAQSLRSLSRNKDLSVLCTVMLALGIGATTVVFSIFYAALVQPLPFRDADHLVGAARVAPEQWH